jgi:hypothetical protein
VPDHVRVGEVDDAEAELVLLPRVDEGAGGLAGAHLGLLVVRRDVARAGHELAPLPFLRRLLAATEEVRHMRVLLGLGNVQLAAALARDDVRQRRLGMRRREGDRIGPALLVPGQRRVAAHDLAAAAIDFAEAGVGQRAGDLAHAVGAEVERDDRIAGADARVVADRRRLDELVGLAALVGGADRLDRRARAVLGAAVDEQVVGLLRAIPALVAIHRPVAPD